MQAPRSQPAGLPPHQLHQRPASRTVHLGADRTTATQRSSGTAPLTHPTANHPSPSTSADYQPYKHRADHHIGALPQPRRTQSIRRHIVTAPPPQGSAWPQTAGAGPCAFTSRPARQETRPRSTRSWPAIGCHAESANPGPGPTSCWRTRPIRPGPSATTFADAESAPSSPNLLTRSPTANARDATVADHPALTATPTSGATPSNGASTPVGDVELPPDQRGHPGRGPHLVLHPAMRSRSLLQIRGQVSPGSAATGDNDSRPHHVRPGPPSRPRATPHATGRPTSGSHEAAARPPAA